MTVGIPPTLRIYGRLTALDVPPLTADDTRHAINSLLSAQQLQQFETQRQFDFAHSLTPELDSPRFRVNAYHQRGYVAGAFRLIPPQVVPFESLGLPESIRTLADKPRGLVLVTGPTGSGKTTTLAALLDVINQARGEHIVTIEDPIEFLHTHKQSIINQRELGSDCHSFADGLKAALRQDPDVILVGEMRDLETMATAITAAETGHLVFATLHTQDTPQTIDRIIDVFPAVQQGQIRAQLSVALQGIVTQMLLPAAGGGPRVVAAEVMIPTPAVRNLIREGKSHQLYSAIQTGSQQGMQTMDASLAQLVDAGRIDADIARSRAHSLDEFTRLLGNIW
jgi:twitching motility protein PilT